MSRKIILISLNWTREKDPARSLGHASILTNLVMHNIETIDKSWSVNNLDFDPEKVICFINTHADMDTFIALGAYVWNETYIQYILSEIKHRNIPGKIIIGGPQVSYMQSEYEDIEDLCCTGNTRKNILEFLYPHADIFIRGYAESALVELLISDDPLKSIPGVHYKGAIDDNSLSTINLDELPSPLLLDIIQPKKFLRWETKRGYPFNCAFCQHKAPRARQYYQFPLERILQEAEWIANHKEIQDIAIIDPTFNIKNTHYLEVLRALITQQYRGKLSLQCRIEFVTDEFLDVLEVLNINAEVVLEFGLQTINAEEEQIIQRKNSLEKITDVLGQCLERNIKFEVSVIYGLPQQTVASFIEGIQFLVTMGVPVIRAWPLMLLRGTKLYDTKKYYDLVESNEKIPHVISSHSFSLQDYKKMQKIADSLQIYNQLPKEDQLQWEVDKQKPHIATLTFAHALSFFRRYKKLIPEEYIVNMRHYEPSLQQIYDEKFGICCLR